VHETGEQALYGNAFVQQQLHGDPPNPAMGGVRPDAPTTKADALKRHERNRGVMDRFIESAMAVEPDPTQGFNSRPNMLKNSAEWLDSGNATLYVLTSTHDAHLRPGVPADNNAYFDTRVDYTSGASTYNDTLDAAGQATDDAGLAIEFSNVAGSMDNNGQSLNIIEPASISEGLLAETLIHEVQHDADQHRAGEAWEVGRPAADPGRTTRAPQWAFNHYQTEFRAYWMMTPEGSTPDSFGLSTDTGVTDYGITAIHVGADGAVGTADDVSQSVNTAFTNKRQEDIFNHMFTPRADNLYFDGAAWTQTYGYLGHYYALDPAFESMVDGYTQPAGGNLVNSIRIQALSDAITAGGLVNALVAAGGLDDLDRMYLKDRTQSQPFWDQALTLGLMGRAVLESVIDVPIMGPHQPAVITVVEGDTLSAISDRYLQDMSRWREIYRLNADVIGNDPHVVRPGLKLYLPAL
jgi:hypothetical protein